MTLDGGGVSGGGGAENAPAVPPQGATIRPVPGGPSERAGGGATENPIEKRGAVDSQADTAAQAGNAAEASPQSFPESPVEHVKMATLAGELPPSELSGNPQEGVSAVPASGDHAVTREEPDTTVGNEPADGPLGERLVPPPHSQLASTSIPGSMQATEQPAPKGDAPIDEAGEAPQPEETTGEESSDTAAPPTPPAAGAGGQGGQPPQPPHEGTTATGAPDGPDEPGGSGSEIGDNGEPAQPAGPDGGQPPSGNSPDQGPVPAPPLPERSVDKEPTGQPNTPPPPEGSTSAQVEAPVTSKFPLPGLSSEVAQRVQESYAQNHPQEQQAIDAEVQHAQEMQDQENAAQEAYHQQRAQQLTERQSLHAQQEYLPNAPLEDFKRSPDEQVTPEELTDRRNKAIEQVNARVAEADARESVLAVDNGRRAHELEEVAQEIDRLQRDGNAEHRIQLQKEKQQRLENMVELDALNKLSPEELTVLQAISSHPDVQGKIWGKILKDKQGLTKEELKKNIQIEAARASVREKVLMQQRGHLIGATTLEEQMESEAYQMDYEDHFPSPDHKERMQAFQRRLDALRDQASLETDAQFAKNFPELANEYAKKNGFRDAEDMREQREKENEIKKEEDKKKREEEKKRGIGRQNKLSYHNAKAQWKAALNAYKNAKTDEDRKKAAGDLFYLSRVIVRNRGKFFLLFLLGINVLTLTLGPVWAMKIAANGFKAG